MVSALSLLGLVLNPIQLRYIIQWKVWHQPVHKRDLSSESATLQKCFELLNKTSRSFSAVIQELHPELRVPVTLFYLILRGLDTIEDDMTIPLEKKELLLRNFHEVIDEDGWTFDGNGPNEKDRLLLVQFDNIIFEFKKLKPNYQATIKSITVKMGNGMADYANNAEYNVNGVDTIQDYELYCHHVAGLVGEGLTEMFVQSELADPSLEKKSQLTESMGQFLQKTNITRDIREDLDDKRRFWPKEVWSKYVDKFEDLLEPRNEEIALACSSEMVLNSLKHVEDCLLYMSNIKDQSVFNFVAIPQSMAIATLELVFRNPKIFQQIIKISKGDACQLMVQSTQDMGTVSQVFKTYTSRIRMRNAPSDSNFAEINIACSKIEKFIDSNFPSQDLNNVKAPNAVLVPLTLLLGVTVGTAYLAQRIFGLATVERVRL